MPTLAICKGRAYKSINIIVSVTAECFCRKGERFARRNTLPRKCTAGCSWNVPGRVRSLLVKAEDQASVFAYGQLIARRLDCKEDENVAKIRLNEDQELVACVKEGLKRTGGYCPCRLERKPEYKCICEEFKAQIQDPDFEGFCHCMLYYKEK